MKKTIVLALTALSLTALPFSYAADKAAPKAGHQCEHCEGKTCKHKGKKGKKHDCKDCAECAEHAAGHHEGEAAKTEGAEAPAAAPTEASH